MTIDFKWKLKTGVEIHVEADGVEWFYDISITVPGLHTFGSIAKAIEAEAYEIEQHATTLLAEAWREEKANRKGCA